MLSNSKEEVTTGLKRKLLQKKIIAKIKMEATSLQQYLDLYRDHKHLLDRHSAPGFNSLREEAYRNLQVTGLPLKGSENYEVTDIAEMLSPDFGINLTRIPLDVNVRDVFKCGLPHLSSSLFFMMNDIWGESMHARQNLPEGIEIGPLSSYMGDGGEARKFYGKLADAANPVVALNNMLVQEGLYIKVKAGVKVERPVQLVNILENTMPLLALRRILIVLEEGAELKILSCSHTKTVNLPMGSVSVAEIYAGRNSRLDFYDMEESGENTRRLTSLYLRQEENSDVLIENFTLHNGQTRNEYNCSFQGEGSSLRLYGLGIEGHKSVLDNYSRIDHSSPHCHTEELFKYILDDESRGAFTGRIYVAPGSFKTEAYQSNRNLVSSEKARMYSKPQLEIYNDDVKCSHGSATGQLDKMQLFYLRSRGLDDAEARLLLKQAFMADVIDGVRLPILRDRLHSLIERRISGADITCGECDACN